MSGPATPIEPLPVDRISRGIGFISTRVAGAHGLSQEVKKWADILGQDGMQFVCVAGESDSPADQIGGLGWVSSPTFRDPALRIHATAGLRMR